MHLLRVLALSSLCATTIATSNYSSIVCFGDSFSDNGNGSYKITNRTWPADPAYYDGRFSNGPVWIEHVAANLSIPLHDYAFGGATTDNTLVEGYTGPNSTILVPGVAQQVASFIDAGGSQTAISSALFVVFGGFNDIFFNPNLTAAQVKTKIHMVYSISVKLCIR